MKLYILVLFVFVSEYMVAQDSTDLHIETPKIVTKLPLGKTYNLDDVAIKFVDVLSDSRCPQDVTCIWAGQVVVLIEVYKSKILLEKKEVVFEPGKNANEDLRTLFASEVKTVIAVAVLPYPKKSREKIKNEDYYLQLEISN